MAEQAPVSSNGVATGPRAKSLGTPLELLLAAARGGNGQLVVVDGPEAPERCDGGDVRVIHVAAAESESELPYAVLADVLRPILHLLHTIPGPQVDALRSAFALASPGGAQRLAICAGTLSLLTAAAPVVVVVEDAQWIDAESAEPLHFAFRRLDGLQVGALLHTRGATPASPPVADDPARGLLDGAAAARAAGKPDRALRLLDEALGCTQDPLLRADVQHLRGLISMWRTAPAQASRQLLTEASRIDALDAAKAASMTADAAWASFMAGDLEGGLEAAERASALGARAGGTAEVLATGLLGFARLLRGQSHDALPLLDRFAPLFDDVQFLEQAPNAVWPAALALLWVEEYAQARDAFTGLVDVARTHGKPTILTHALLGLSELEFRTGDWPSARGAASDAAHLAEETGQPVAHALALLALARISAPQGREDDCTAHVFEAVRLAPSGAGAVLAYAGTHLGALELALGRSDATISHLEQVAHRTAEHGLREPGVVQWAPDLIEAHVRCGHIDEASAALDDLEEQAGATGRVWALAAAARCRGLLAPLDAFDSAFLEARELHESTPTPFELARTELCYGERLRRARRRADARAPLRRALGIFERLGAEPYAERTRSELRATGETVRSGDAARSDELTPQELEIARIVAAGATNREAATALYLSPKTIETHLGRVYRKLHVRSRTELARLLA